MCGLIFHKDPSTGLHRSWLLFLKNHREMPHALDRFHEWYVTLLFGEGRGRSDFLQSLLRDLGDMILWSISLKEIKILIEIFKFCH